MANGKKFMIGHLGLGSNVQLGLVDFKVCDWLPETSLQVQSQTLKSCKNPFGQLKPVSVGWSQNIKIHKTKLDI